MVTSLDESSFTNVAFKSDEAADGCVESPPPIADDTKFTSSLLYKIDDKPSWLLSILLGMQHYLTMIGSAIAVPLILFPALCIAKDDPVRGTFISTVLFISGISTILQSTLGVRLPIVQGSTFTFLVPAMSILSSSFPACADVNFSNMTSEERAEEWGVRIREVQGAIILSSLAQVVISCSGLLGLVLHWITPLTIAPTITLIGLSLFSMAADKCAGNWFISGMTMAILTLFSQYMSEIRVPIPSYARTRGLFFQKVKIFATFPVLLGLVVTWGVCAILTATDTFAADSPARTDLKLSIVSEAPWFYMPYPFQFRMPTVSLAGVIGMLSGVMASMIESVGDYYACAKICCIPPPPVHAVNRGIGMEGFGNLLAGIWGTGNGTTSYSENIGALRITKVVSRRVIQVGGLVMIICGLFGKFGAFCSTMPDPIIGGMFVIVFSMISAIGISNLQTVDLNSSRNLFIFGFSLFFGLALPKWMSANKDAIQTGSPLLDQVLLVLLSTPMFVGGVFGFVLDNTMKGTLEERGLHMWGESSGSVDSINKPETSHYDLPFGMDCLRRWTWSRYVPISPTFMKK